MKIKEISLQNFRCFEQLTVHFNPQMNVLIGDNASGKTAVLDAIRELSKPFFTQIIREQAEWRNGEENVRRIFASDNKEFVFPHEIILHFTNDITSRYKIYNDADINVGELDFNELHEFALELKQKRTQNELFPIIVHYNTARLWNYAENKDNQGHKANGSRLEGYLNALPVNAMTFAGVTQRWNTLQEEERLSGNQEPALIAMRKAIMTVIASCKNVYFSNKQGTLVFQNEKNEIFPFHLLSDGYRNMLAMVSDIAYRCYTLNPHLKEDACLKTEGFILIDEIDLHLHPKWQKQVIESLKKAFPNIQFIVTTHSPLILSTVANNEILDLENIKENHLYPRPASYQGLSIDFILSQLMEIQQDTIDPTKDIEAALERWVLLEKREKRETPYLIEMGGKSYSLIDILQEVKHQTEVGKRFANSLFKLTVELLLRGKVKLEK